MIAVAPKDSLAAASDWGNVLDPFKNCRYVLINDTQKHTYLKYLKSYFYRATFNYYTEFTKINAKSGIEQVLSFIVVKLTLMWHTTTNSSNRGSGLYQSSKQTRTYQGFMWEYNVRDVTALNISIILILREWCFAFTAIWLYSCIAEMLQHRREVLCFPRFQHSAVSGAWQMGWDSS